MNQIFNLVRKVFISFIIFPLVLQTAEASSNYCNSTTAPDLPGKTMVSCDSVGNSYSVAVVVLYRRDENSSTHTYDVVVSLLNSVWDPLNFGNGTCTVKRDKSRHTSHEYATLGSFNVPTGSFEKEVSFSDSFNERKNYEVFYTISCNSAWSLLYPTLSLTVFDNN